MAHTNMVYSAHGTFGGCPSDYPESTGSAEFTTFGEETLIENDIGGMSSVWIKFQEQGISGEVLQIFKQSWRESTRSQYAGFIKKWTSFCSERDIHFHPSLNDIYK